MLPARAGSSRGDLGHFRFLPSKVTKTPPKIPPKSFQNAPQTCPWSRFGALLAALGSPWAPFRLPGGALGAPKLEKTSNKLGKELTRNLKMAFLGLPGSPGVRSWVISAQLLLESDGFLLDF